MYTTLKSLLELPPKPLIEYHKNNNNENLDKRDVASKSLCLKSLLKRKISVVDISKNDKHSVLRSVLSAPVTCLKPPSITKSMKAAHQKRKKCEALVDEHKLHENMVMDNQLKELTVKAMVKSIICTAQQRESETAQLFNETESLVDEQKLATSPSATVLVNPGNQVVLPTVVPIGNRRKRSLDDVISLLKVAKHNRPDDVIKLSHHVTTPTNIENRGSQLSPAQKFEQTGSLAEPTMEKVKNSDHPSTWYDDKCHLRPPSRETPSPTLNPLAAVRMGRKDGEGNYTTHNDVSMYPNMLCYICCEWFCGRNRRVHMSAHLRAHKFKCGICGFSGRSDCHIRGHAEMMHGGDFQCIESATYTEDMKRVDQEMARSLLFHNRYMGLALIGKAVDPRQLRDQLISELGDINDIPVKTIDSRARRARCEKLTLNPNIPNIAQIANSPGQLQGGKEV